MKHKYPLKIRLYGCLILSSLLSGAFFGVIMLTKLFVNRGEPLWQIGILSLAVGFATVFLLDRMDNGPYRTQSVCVEKSEPTK
jgi:hypothetical protein